MHWMHPETVSTRGSFCELPDGPQALPVLLQRLFPCMSRLIGPPPLSYLLSSWKAPSVFVPVLPLLPRTPSSQLPGVPAKNK